MLIVTCIAVAYFLARAYCVFRSYRWRGRANLTYHISSALMAVFMPVMLLNGSWAFLLVTPLDSMSIARELRDWGPKLDLAGRPMDEVSLNVGVSTAQIALWLLVMWL